jgi:hypothetical protein
MQPSILSNFLGYWVAFLATFCEKNTKNFLKMLSIRLFGGDFCRKSVISFVQFKQTPLLKWPKINNSQKCS